LTCGLAAGVLGRTGVDRAMARTGTVLQA
jgi:hypothetical protein